MDQASTLLTLAKGVAALGAVLALIWLAQRAARASGFSRAPASGALSVQSVLALDSRRRLLIVACHDRRVLLLTGGAQDVVVGWLDPETAR